MKQPAASLTSHPFRQTLPPPVIEPAVERLGHEPLGSLGLFTLTFVSAFLAFSTFLA